MSATIYKGQVLTKNDLKVYILDTQSNYVDPFSITYTIYRIISGTTGSGTSSRRCNCGGNDTIVHGTTWWEQGKWLENTEGNQAPQRRNAQSTGNAGYNWECGEEPVVETLNTVPIPFGIGKYFAAWRVANDLDIGSYRIHWHVRRFADSPIYEEIEEFNVLNKVDQLNYSALNGGSVLPHELYGNQNSCAG